jgi:prevent-host-death family protein
MPTRSVSEARATLPELLDRVEGGEEVAITRHGKVVAVLIGPERLRVRRAEALYAEAAALHDRIEAARARPLSANVGLSPGRADELVAKIRRDRDAR